MIQVRVYGDDPALAAGKPAPDPFLLAAKRLGRNPVDCWAFEDSAAGIEAAVAAGCQVYALLPSDAFAQATPAGVSRLNSLRDVRW
jgi:beta-phosphoglucomutase-like phosphatase (HAD superfamily)